MLHGLKPIVFRENVATHWILGILSILQDLTLSILIESQCELVSKIQRLRDISGLEINGASSLSACEAQFSLCGVQCHNASYTNVHEKGRIY